MDYSLAYGAIVGGVARDVCTVSGVGGLLGSGHGNSHPEPVLHVECFHDTECDTFEQFKQVVDTFCEWFAVAIIAHWYGVSFVFTFNEPVTFEERVHLDVSANGNCECNSFEECIIVRVAKCIS